MVGFELVSGEEQDVNGTIKALLNLTVFTNATFVMKSTSWLVTFYCILPIVLLGTIGNLLSIAVFRSTKLRRVSASYYLTMLSISDTGFLMNLFAVWLEMVDINAFNQPVLCQFFSYIAYVCSFLSPWLIVIFTIERFVATCYPLWRAVICTVTRAKVIVALLVCVASLSYVYIPFVIGMELADATYQCDLKPGFENTWYTLNVLDMMFTLVVPTILIIVLNVKIAMAIWHFEHVRRHMTMASMPNEECSSNSTDLAAMQLNAGVGTSTPVAGKHGRARNCCSNYQVKITKMLLIISSVFIGLNTPSYLIRIMVFFMSKEECDSYNCKDLQHYGQLGYYLNFAINFLLYCVSGQNFRRSLKSMLSKMTHRTRHRQLSRSNTGTMIANCNNSTISNNTMSIGLIATYQSGQTVKSASAPEETRNGKDTA